MILKERKILVDSREFIKKRVTGIGRFLRGLTDALAVSEKFNEIILAGFDESAVPEILKRHKVIRFIKLPCSYLSSEKKLSNLTRQKDILFISPYPKIPLFGCFCKSVQTIHDILYITHPAYRKRLGVLIDRYRLKKALKIADLTWYDSNWSMNETRKVIGHRGKNFRVRYPAIDNKFTPDKDKNDEAILKKYALQSGYVLVVGNGLPHKNIDILLQITNRLNRHLVFVGVSKKNKQFWMKKYPKQNAEWINYVADEELPSLIRGAFCLAQPSTAEGYGYPPLEAMACGVPAVVSNIPVLTETTGGAALLEDPNDPDAWLKAFAVLEKENIYQKLSDRGLNRVRSLQGYRGWGKYLTDIIQLIEAK